VDWAETSGYHGRFVEPSTQAIPASSTNSISRPLGHFAFQLIGRFELHALRSNQEGVQALCRRRAGPTKTSEFMTGSTQLRIKHTALPSLRFRAREGSKSRLKGIPDNSFFDMHACGRNDYPAPFSPAAPRGARFSVLARTFSSRSGRAPFLLWLTLERGCQTNRPVPRLFRQ
jgi:hypothetical protein